MTKELRELIAQQRAAQAKYNEDLTKLTEGNKYSKEYIAAQRAEMASTYAADKAARGKQAADVLTRYKAQVKGKLDLSDPALSNLIALTNAMGESTPRAVLDSAVEHFKGNNTALNAIKGIIAKNGIEYATIDRFIIDESALDNAIIEAGTDFDRNGDLSPLGIAAIHIDEVEAAEIAPENIAPSSIPTIF